MISVLVAAGLEGGYLASATGAGALAQAGRPALPSPQVSYAGKSVFWVDPNSPQHLPPSRTS